MSLFKKPKRNFRNRRQDSEVDGEKPAGDNNEADDDVIVVDEWPQRAPAEEAKLVVKKIKKKKKDKLLLDGGLPRVASGTSVLSFEADVQEEEEVFKIKRSSHSRKVAKQLKRESKKEKEEREKREEEKTGIPMGGGTKQKDVVEKQTGEVSNGGSADDVEVGSDAGASSLSNLGEDDEEGDREEEEKGHKFSKSFKNMLQSGEIPDANLIHMVRKRRQMAREMGDFIPLDDTVRVEKSNSRLIREEDHDHSEDSDEERVSFSVGKQREDELRKIQTTILAAEEESHSDDSDRGEAWEMQQIRKGVSMPTGQVGASQIAPPEEVSNYQQYIYGQQQQSTLFQTPGAPTRGFGGPPGPPQAPSSGSQGRGGSVMPPIEVSGITIEQIKKRMTDRLEEMSDVHRAHAHERDDLESRAESCDSSIEQMEGSSASLEERYQFFQEMRGYVRDLVECLNEKVPTIDSLDRLMLNLLKLRTDKLVKRRQEDIQDQNQENIVGRAVDHAGNHQDFARQRRAAEREARRARRRRAREATGVQEHKDGMSTDDEESNSDILRFNQEKDRLMTETHAMFEDVVEDFHEFGQIKQHFEKWKFKQGESYEEAYIGLCLPKLFTPLIRLKLVHWNPLEADCASFEQSSWYESLMFYGHQDGQFPELGDSDLKLIPSLVEKVLLPKLAGLIENVWDPLSTRQTTHLVTLLRKIWQDHPALTADSKHTKQLVKAAVMRMRKTLDDDIYMPLYPPQVLENAHSGGAIFFHRQFWSCVKFLGNMLQWHCLVSDPVLQEMALDCTLNRYLLLALSSAQLDHNTIAKCESIINLFPRAWFSGLSSDSTLPQLENLCRLLTHSANKLQQTGGKGLDKKEMRDRIKQISKLFINIHAMDHALTLANTHGIRINK